MLIHLIPLGGARHELYTEVPDVEDGPLAHDAGRLRRWLHGAGEQWREYVDAARLSTATGGFARGRDAVIRKLASTLDEQRTLRALRTTDAAALLFPAGLESAAARAALDRLLAASQRHHGQWLAAYLTLFILSGVLFFIPGPNIVAYYLGFRALGHLQAWRGARHGSVDVKWTLQSSADLEELAALARQPHAARAERVRAVSQRLALEHLPAFFERATA